ncbi:MAG: LOG family protein [Anaerolineales bacterium]
MKNFIQNNSIVHVTVFGGSQPKPDSSAYIEAYRLGKLLGKQGFIILNGGYMGTMEAVSKGAKEAGAKVIGITCDQIEDWRPVAPNPYLSEEKRYPTLRERLYALIDLCDIAIALPGGIGTLAEISAMWTQIDIQAIPPKPLILIGKGWHKIIEHFFEVMQDYVSQSQREELLFAKNIDEAVSFLTSLKLTSP